MMRVDSEPEIQPWDGRFTDSNSDYDAVVVSDYNKGFLSAEQIHELIRFSDCPVFIDTKKRDLELFDMPDTYVKINELEHSMVTSQHPNLIVTLGSRGAMYNEKVYPTKSVEVADVCGAGDTFLAALTVEYLLTNDIEKAILFANAASGVTVQHRGNYAPTYKEITDNE
jgi:D-beta-D-heptose 7-phosphate kinase/D-beta-D-heptose 1-phosphate adenosyltransferase